MKNKSRALVFGSATIAIALIVVFVQYNAKNSGTIYTVKSTNEQSPVTSASKESVKPSTSITVSTPKTTSTTTVTQTKANEYTLAQVATHNTSSNCWTAINGGVYNVASWISQHPGGSEAIISLCGIDGSSEFNDQHGGQRRPASELASFKIGTLK